MNEVRDHVTRVAARMLRSHYDVEDVTQEVMARLIARERAGERIESERAFAVRAAVHLVVDRLRSRRSQRDGRFGLAAHVAQVQNAARRDDPAPTPADVAQLYDAIAALPARQAAVITMRKLLEMEYADIAAVLGASQANCRSHCRHGMLRLREILTQP